MLATWTWLVARSWTRVLGLAAILFCSSLGRVWRRRRCSGRSESWPPGHAGTLSIVHKCSVCLTGPCLIVTSHILTSYGLPLHSMNNMLLSGMSSGESRRLPRISIDPTQRPVLLIRIGYLILGSLLPLASAHVRQFTPLSRPPPPAACQQVSRKMMLSLNKPILLATNFQDDI